MHYVAGAPCAAGMRRGINHRGCACSSAMPLEPPRALPCTFHAHPARLTPPHVLRQPPPLSCINHNAHNLLPLTRLHIQSLERHPERSLFVQRSLLATTLAGNALDCLTITAPSPSPEALRKKRGAVITGGSATLRGLGSVRAIGCALAGCTVRANGHAGKEGCGTVRASGLAGEEGVDTFRASGRTVGGGTFWASGHA